MVDDVKSFLIIHTVTMILTSEPVQSVASDQLLTKLNSVSGR